MKNIATIGSGSWGVALALHCHRLGHRVSIWAPFPEECQRLCQTRELQAFLPGHIIPEQVLISGDLTLCCSGVDAVLLAVPSHAVRRLAKELSARLSPGTALISAVKGIETDSLMRVSEILREFFSGDFPVLSLSGPSFAAEVARGDPTAVVLACGDLSTARQWQRELSGRNLRIYANEDLIGTELGGAVKNVVAIASGVLHGLGYGANTIAALITRGLAEIKRLAMAAGGRSETMAGLAGLGDLVLTCTGGASRNRQVGIALGNGQKLPDILKEIGQVAEGVKTTESTLGLARRYGVEMPIVSQMYAILHDGISPEIAIAELMKRELKSENGS